MKLTFSVITILAFFANGISSDNVEENPLIGDFLDTLATTSKPDFPIIIRYHVLPSPDTPLTDSVGRRGAEEQEVIDGEFEPLGGTYLYEDSEDDDNDGYLEYFPDKAEESIDAIEDLNDKDGIAEENESKRSLDTLGSMQIHSIKRPFDTLGGMQLHSFKRSFDTLGGANLHGGYKRFVSSLGGTHVHNYKRAADRFGGSYIPAYKRYFSSLGGGNIHGGYKRSMDKRYFSSLGGAYIYKRPFDTLGGALLHGGYKKRFFSSLGGANIHNGGSRKRTLSSLGGMNIHSGAKRYLSSLGGGQIYEYKRDNDKRSLDSLGGYNIHRYKRSDAGVDTKAAKAEDMQKQ